MGSFPEIKDGKKATLSEKESATYLSADRPPAVFLSLSLSFSQTKHIGQLVVYSALQFVTTKVFHAQHASWIHLAVEQRRT